jgi:hypothetical protein
MRLPWLSFITLVFILPGAIVFAADEMMTRTFKVSPDFPNWRADASDKRDTLNHQPGAIEILKAFGADFPEGASAVFNRATSQLVVRNTPKNLVRVEGIVEELSGRIPVQVHVTTRILIFDSKVRREELTALFVSGASDDKAAPLQEPATASVNDLQTLPGVMALTGVLTPEQSNAWFQYLGGHPTEEELGSAEQKKKTGELYASLTAKKAAPKPVANLPMQSVTLPSGSNTSVGWTRDLLLPAGPSREALTKKVGLSVSITPAIGPDGYTIDLMYVPRMGGPLAWRKSTKGALAPEIPVFPDGISSFENSGSTAVTIWDGQTVLFGGLAYLPDFVLHPEHQGQDALLAKPYQVLAFVKSRMIAPNGKALTEAQRGHIKPANQPLTISEWAVKDVSLHDAVKELAELSKQEDPKGEGCNVIFRAAETTTIRITLRLHDFTVREALAHLASAADLSIKQEDDNTYILAPKP